MSAKTTASTTAAPGTVRPLQADDLAQVIEIDRTITGRSRRGFYEKRLQAALKHPDDMVALGYAEDGRLCGFVLSHILDGEFGGCCPAAMLDAIGVAPDARHRGAGHTLLAALDVLLIKRRVRELRTEAPWTERELLRLFTAAGFTLAPRYILERSTADGEPI